MAIDPKKLIAAINPDLFCSDQSKKEVKSLISSEISKLNKKIAEKKKNKEKVTEADAKTDIYLEAAKKAELKETGYVDVIDTYFTKSALKLTGIKEPIEQHSVSYDLSGNTNQILEELYFWIIDWLNKEWGKSEKLIDNFIASPGSSLFTENLQKRASAEQNASRILGNINEVIKSIINLIYSQKEYQTVLQLYDKRKSKNPDEKQGALLALKQRWLDKVDIQKGGSSIKQLSVTGANQPNFVLLIDTFMASDKLEDVDKLDLNDRIKRLLKQRLQEYLVWLEESEKSLRSRANVEKNYLKSQVNSLRLYANWVKPYLKSAHRLQENASPDSSFVNFFNTALFELSVLGIGKYGPEQDIADGEIPEYFKKLKLRKYNPIVIVEMKFRTTPESVGQHARFRGKLEATFTSFALNDDELSLFKEQLEKDDIKDVLGAIEGATTDSIEQIERDVDEILGNNIEKEEEKEDKKDEDTNPFTALFSFFKPKKKSSEIKPGIRPDSEEEKVIRSQALLLARWNTRKIYDTFKKTLNMPAFAPVSK